MRSVAGWPSSGSRWRNWSATRAVAQAASSRRPSRARARGCARRGPAAPRGRWRRRRRRPGSRRARSGRRGRSSGVRRTFESLRQGWHSSPEETGGVLLLRASPRGASVQCFASIQFIGATPRPDGRCRLANPFDYSKNPMWSDRYGKARTLLKDRVSPRVDVSPHLTGVPQDPKVEEPRRRLDGSDSLHAEGGPGAGDRRRADRAASGLCADPVRLHRRHRTRHDGRGRSRRHRHRNQHRHRQQG